MQDFTSHLLRSYFASTDWHPANSYLHLTSSSSTILLDFPIPTGVSLAVSSSPSSTFYSNHRLRCMPHLTGSAGYVFARTEKPLRLVGQEGDEDGESGIAGLRLRQCLDRFRIVNVPKRPEAKTQRWETDSGVEKRDYLLYGCLHAPSARLDALFTTRISPTWNLIVTACSFPPRRPSTFTSNAPNSLESSQQLQQPNLGVTAPGATNLHCTLQNDTGKWFNEITYNVDDALWGFRTMHHFGPSSRQQGSSNDSEDWTTFSQQPATTSDAARKSEAAANLRSDEETSQEVGGGLRGRFSAGAELFFSASEKSAGLSTGVRFTTLPEGREMESRGLAAATYVPTVTAASSSGEASEAVIPTDGPTTAPVRLPPSQPPTTITATLNPMMGHLSTAYASKVGDDVVVCSRFDFNVYSYESALTVGGEYWLKTSTVNSQAVTSEGPVSDASASSSHGYSDSTARTLAQARGAAASYDDDRLPPLRSKLEPRPLSPEVSLREGRPTGSTSQVPTSPPRELSLREEKSAMARSSKTATPTPKPSTSPPPSGPSAPTGLLKWSLSSSMLLSLLWQGRLKNCLVSIGLKADLTGDQTVVGNSGKGSSSASSTGIGIRSVLKGIGMDIVYYGGSSSSGTTTWTGEERAQGTIRIDGE